MLGKNTCYEFSAWRQNKILRGEIIQPDEQLTMVARIYPHSTQYNYPVMTDFPLGTRVYRCI